MEQLEGSVEGQMGITGTDSTDLVESETGAQPKLAISVSSTQSFRDDNFSVLASQSLDEEKETGRASSKRTLKERQHFLPENGSGIVQEEMLSFLKSLEKFWSCISLIALCVLTTDGEVSEKMEDLLASSISDKTDFVRTTEDITKKGHKQNRSAAENFIVFLGFFKIGKHRNNSQNFFESKAKSEKKALLRSLKDAIDRRNKEKQGTCDSLLKEFETAQEQSKQADLKLNNSLASMLVGDDNQLSVDVDRFLAPSLETANIIEQYIKIFDTQNKIDVEEVKKALDANHELKQVFFDALFSAFSEQSDDKQIKSFKKNLEKLRKIDKDLEGLAASELFKNSDTLGGRLTKCLHDANLVIEGNCASQDDIKRRLSKVYVIKRESLFQEIQKARSSDVLSKSLVNRKQVLKTLEDEALDILRELDVSSYEDIVKELKREIPPETAVARFLTETEVINEKSIEDFFKKEEDKEILHHAVTEVLSHARNNGDVRIKEYKEAQKQCDEVETRFMTILQKVEENFPGAVRKELIRNAIHSASLTAGQLCECLKGKGAKIIKTYPKFRRSSFTQLIIIRNKVIHMIPKLESDELKESYMKALERVTDETGMQVNQEIQLLGRSKEAAKYFGHCIKLIEKNDSNSKTIRYLKTRIEKLKRDSESQEQLIKEADERERQLKANKRELSEAIRSFREYAEAMLEKCDSLASHMD